MLEEEFPPGVYYVDPQTKEPRPPRPKLPLLNRRPPDKRPDPLDPVANGFRKGLVHYCFGCGQFSPVFLEADLDYMSCVACTGPSEMAMVAYVKLDYPKRRNVAGVWPQDNSVPMTRWIRGFLSTPDTAADAEARLYESWGPIHALYPAGTLLYSYRQLCQAYRDTVLLFNTTYKPDLYPAGIWFVEQAEILWNDYTGFNDYYRVERDAVAPDILSFPETRGPLLVCREDDGRIWRDVSRKYPIIFRDPLGEEEPHYEDERTYA